MNPNSRILKIGPVEKQDHYFLTASDLCYFFGNYLACSDGEEDKRPWERSDVNKFVFNFKKPVRYKTDPNVWKWKLQAIQLAVQLYTNSWNWGSMAKSNYAFVPMPPSKAKTDKDYDSRMVDMLMSIQARVGCNLDIRDCLSFSGAIAASHTQAPGERSSVEDLLGDLQFDAVSGKPMERPVAFILFDDVVTTGRHFKAAQSKLNEVFEGVPVIGAFLARRLIVDPTPFEKVDLSNFFI